MVVVSGSNAQHVAEQLAQSLGWSHVKLEARRFPDSEGYIRIPEDEIEAIRSEPVVVVSNTFPDAGIVETMLILKAVSDVRKGSMENLRGIEPQKMEDIGPESTLRCHILDILAKTSDSSLVRSSLHEPLLICCRTV